MKASKFSSVLDSFFGILVTIVTIALMVWGLLTGIDLVQDGGFFKSLLGVILILFCGGWLLVGAMLVLVWTGPAFERVLLRLHACEWEYRADPGEEEHGKNPARRYCKICGREQWAFYHRFGDTCISWSDAPDSKKDKPTVSL